MKRSGFPVFVGLVVALVGTPSGQSAPAQSGPDLPARVKSAAALIDASTANAAATGASWRTRFVGRLKRADGSAVDSDRILTPIRDAERALGDLHADAAALQTQLGAAGSLDSEAVLNRLDAIAEDAILTRWRLARADADLSVELVQTSYDDAVEQARRQFGQPAQAEAYADAESLARQAAYAAFARATDALVGARRHARLSLETWMGALTRESTTRRVAEAIDTHLNVSPGCAAAVRTELDRFLCERNVVFAGAPGERNTPRAEMASAFDAYDIDLKPMTRARAAAYAFREPAQARFVAGYESLGAPLWPERQVWSRSLPPAVATAIERGSRLLMFHGLGLVPDGGGEPTITSEDPRVVYQLLATARGSVAAEHREPAVWDGYMRPRWSSGAWLTLRQQIVPLGAPPEWEETIGGADLVMVLARVLPGSLPGQKNLRIGGLAGQWILPESTAYADVHFVREHAAGAFEAIRNGFVGEKIRVAVRLDVAVPLDDIPVRIVGGDETQKAARDAAQVLSSTLNAVKQAGDPTLYLSQPFGLEWLPDYVRIRTSGVIPVFTFDRLFATVDTHEIALRNPGRVTVQRDPSSIAFGWQRAVENVAKVHGTTVGSDLRAFLSKPSASLTTSVRYEMPRTPLDGATGGLNSIEVSMGHHAALLLLRDELVQALKEVEGEFVELEKAYAAGDLRARAHLRQLELALADPSSPWQVVPVNGPADLDSLPRPGTFALGRVGEFWSAARREVPFARIVDDPYLSRHFDAVGAQRWRVGAAAQAVAYFRTALQASRTHALRINDDDLDGLLGLVRFGFEPIVARVLPDMVMATADPAAPWRSDSDSRPYVSNVLDLADRYGAGRDAGELQRQIAFAAVALGTFVVAPEAMAFRLVQVAVAGLTAVELAQFSVPQYLERRAEVRFATGISPLLGTDRLRWAEARAIPEWQVAVEAAFVVVGGRLEFRALIEQVRLSRELARMPRILNLLRGSELSLARLDAADQAKYLAILGDALMTARRGDNLSPIQRAVVDSYHHIEQSVKDSLFDRVRRGTDGPPVWHAARGRNRRVVAAISKDDPRAPYLGQVQRFRAVDVFGRTVTYHVGELIGSGQGAFVYECLNVPGVVIKFRNPQLPVSPDAWLNEAIRVDGLLTQEGIRHLTVVAVSRDAQLPFYVQQRLPEDAATFGLQQGIVGYEVRRAGTIVPPTATAAELRALEQEGVVRLQHGYSLAGGNGTLDRQMQRALLRLYKRIGRANLIAEDLHLDNVYFVRKGLTWEAGVLDLESVGRWNEDLGDYRLTAQVLAIEHARGQRMRDVLPSMAGRDYAPDIQILIQRGATRVYPDADFFMEKMLEYKWYIRYLPAEQRWVGSILDLDVVEEFYPNFRSHVTPNLVDLANHRGPNRIPGPIVEADVEPAAPTVWVEMVGPRGPPEGTPPPAPISDPNAPIIGGSAAAAPVAAPPAAPRAPATPRQATSGRLPPSLQRLVDRDPAAVARAHLVGIGEIGADGVRPAQVGNYTFEQIRAKAEILPEADGRRGRRGCTGFQPRGPTQDANEGVGADGGRE
jgi:hypothetical protein